MLKNALGRTQNMPIWANVHTGFGGDCDKIQQEYGPMLVSVNYSEMEWATLENYKQAYIVELSKRKKTLENYLINNKSEKPEYIQKQIQLNTYRELERKF